MQARRFQQALDKFLGYLPESGRVFDLDYGHGEYAKIFEAAGYETVVLDPHGYSINDNHPESREIIKAEIQEVSLPYRTISGIWIKDVLLAKNKEELARYLSQFVDWLEVSGIMHFCLLEGEGYKIVEEHLPTGVKTLKHYYYSPIELELALQQAGAVPLEAWYEQQGGKNWIHVIAQRI